MSNQPATHKMRLSGYFSRHVNLVASQTMRLPMPSFEQALANIIKVHQHTWQFSGRINRLIPQSRPFCRAEQTFNTIIFTQHLVCYRLYRARAKVKQSIGCFTIFFSTVNNLSATWWWVIHKLFTLPRPICKVFSKHSTAKSKICEISL